MRPIGLTPPSISEADRRKIGRLNALKFFKLEDKAAPSHAAIGEPRAARQAATASG